MKDSGVEWLGDVPSHWDVCRLKRICRLEYGDSLANDSRVPGEIAVYGSNGVVGQHDKANTIAPCIVVGRKGSFGKVNYCYEPAFAIDTTFFVDGRFSGADMRWLYHLLGWLRLDEVTKDSAVPGLDREDAYQRFAPLPVQKEQPAIARFLDHATDRIDRRIRAKEKLIALLEEQNQVLVHDAVTGRINVRTGKPYPAYKPSGVEWLGNVPERWRVRRLKSLVARIDQGVSPQAENRLCDGDAWGVLKAGCVNGGVFRQKEHKRLAADFAFDPTLAIANGDVLASRASGSPHLVGSVGRVSSLKYKLILSDKTFRLVFKHEFNAEFMVLAMNSRYYREQVDRAISGAEGLANNLPLSSLRAFFLIVPPTQEQNDIVLKLREATSRLNAAAKRTKQEISLLHEYRTRLMADVVTGKLDVREAASRLPDDMDASVREATDAGPVVN